MTAVEEVARKLGGLAERVEAATGPDRVLNSDVLLALGWSVRDGMALNPAGDRAMRIPDLLGSIDDAMGLVPANCLALVRELWDGGTKTGYAILHRYTDNMWVADYAGNALTMAQALVAAALRASAAVSGEG